jgi:hypothetical protein
LDPVRLATIAAVWLTLAPFWPANAQQREFSIVEGKVVSAATGEPIPRALVALRPPAPSGENGPGGYAMETDESGMFHFEKIEPGPYDLSARKPGYLTTNFGARKANGLGATIELAAGEMLTELTLKMPRQAVITGNVTDDRGEPVAAASVGLLRKGWINGQRSLVYSFTTQTDELGGFRLAGIAPRKYYLRVELDRSFWGRQPKLVDRQGNAVNLHLTAGYFGDSDSLEGASLLQIQAGQE